MKIILLENADMLFLQAAIRKKALSQKEVTLIYKFQQFLIPLKTKPKISGCSAIYVMGLILRISP